MRCIRSVSRRFQLAACVEENLRTVRGFSNTAGEMMCARVRSSVKSCSAPFQVGPRAAFALSGGVGAAAFASVLRGVAEPRLQTTDRDASASLGWSCFLVQSTEPLSCPFAVVSTCLLFLRLCGYRRQHWEWTAHTHGLRLCWVEVVLSFEAWQQFTLANRLSLGSTKKSFGEPPRRQISSNAPWVGVAAL